MNETMRVLEGQLSIVDNVSGELSGGSQLLGSVSKFGLDICGSVAAVESINGSLSKTEIIKDPYYEVDNSYGTTIYIGE